MEEITLPSGGTATLRDVRELRGGDKADIRRRCAAAETTNRTELGIVVEEEIAKQLITAWALPYAPGAKLPTEDPATWRGLEIADYDALTAAARPAIPILFPAEATPDDAGVPGSPTVPADA